MEWKSWAIAGSAVLIAVVLTQTANSGTHTAATGEIGLIKLVGEGSVSSGVRRVEAVSGMGSLGEFRRDFEVARAVGQMVGASDSSPAEALRAKIAAQEEEMKKLRRELDAMRMKQASAAAGEAKATEVKGVKLLIQRVDGLERGPMRDLVDQMRSKLGSGVVVLGAASDGKVALIVGVTKDLAGKVHAGKVVGQLAALVGGKGGGRPDLAEAGGSDAGALDGETTGTQIDTSGSAFNTHGSRLAAPSYSELFSEVQRAKTFVPTDVMTAIAATTISPAIRAYSRTSPPCSSRASFANRFFIAFMCVSL